MIGKGASKSSQIPRGSSHEKVINVPAQPQQQHLSPTRAKHNTKARAKTPQKLPYAIIVISLGESESSPCIASTRRKTQSTHAQTHTFTAHRAARTTGTSDNATLRTPPPPRIDFPTIKQATSPPPHHHHMRTSILALAPPRRRTALVLPFPLLLALLLVLVLAWTTPSVDASGSAPWGASSVRTVPVVGGGKLPWGVAWVGGGGRRDHRPFTYIIDFVRAKAEYQKEGWSFIYLLCLLSL